jgi:hypothetical protein
MSDPAQQDFKHHQGDDFEVGVLVEEMISAGPPEVWAALDLTAWMLTSQVRKARTGELVTQMTVTKLNQVTDKGWLILECIGTETEDWPAGPGLEYDIQYVEGGKTFTILYGTISGTKQVTTP